MSEVQVMEKVVTKIPQRIQPLTRMPLNASRKRRVAGYARVSTDSEEQENSYEAQVDYFTEYIRGRDDWSFVKIYTDEGITGTSTKHREGFNEMIADALAGKIDLIVTKSVSRFARNTVDSLTVIRELKANGVEVYFEKENIYTFDGKGELMLTIMSSLAQEESRSISENVTWGIRKGFADGKVPMPYGSFLGYRKGDNGLPEIVPEEAEVVRTIYMRYLNGFTPHQIARSLTEKHIPTPRGGEIWCESTILSILRNERYKGDAILQKSFCTDFLTKKKKKNEGEVSQYYVRNSHPAIVSEEVYELVQLEIEARKEYGNRYSGKGLFTSRIVCGDCGGFFGSKVWHSTDRYRRTIWRCNRKYESGAPKDQRCTTPHVTEFAIMDSFVRLMEHVIADKGMILASCQAILDEIMATDDMDQKIAKLQDQAAGLAQRIRGLVSQNARETRDQSKFQEEYEPLTRQYEALTKKIEGIQREKASKTSRAKRIRIFMGMLKEQEECLEFDPVLFAAFVEKVVVSGQKREVVLTFILRDGSEHRITA